MFCYHVVLRMVRLAFRPPSPLLVDEPAALLYWCGTVTKKEKKKCIVFQYGLYFFSCQQPHNTIEEETFDFLTRSNSSPSAPIES